jgi:Cytochrome c554 and c-prime
MKFGLACAAGFLALAFVSSEATSLGSQKKSPAQTAAPSPNAKPKSAPSTRPGLAAKPKLFSRQEYVGDAACARCHQPVVDSYEKTAHHVTSQVANKDTIVGTFSPGANTMGTANPNLWFRMDEKNDGFYQTAIWGPCASPTEPAVSASSSQTAETRTHTERLDLVIGSGGKGQTYLFWKNDELYQLPVGYSTVLHQWINSPGYVDGSANFDRRIIPRCLECHATYFESVLPGPTFNLYDTKNFILGISCERCHGPGRKHVETYASRSSAHAASAIVNPAKLSRARRADVCAQCHGGQGEREILPAFTYIPGQPLEKYIDLGPIDSAADVDVHGKQGKLLMKSRCYQMSADLNCSTCHDVHKPEPDLAVISQHCLSCHKTTASVTHAKAGSEITRNCIDCHMPKLESKVVYLDVNGKRIKPRFRTHWIKIYSEIERQ